MIPREDIQNLVAGYEKGAVCIAAVASHSALDTFDGACEEGFPTLAVCKRGRHATYDTYFRRRTVTHEEKTENIGCVDETWVLDTFDEILDERYQQKLRERQAVFVPNRSFTSYCDIDVIENAFRVPLFGSRCLLRMEERGEKQDYYWLLEKQGMPFPEKITDPKDISELSIVKLHHAVKKLERGFFTCSSYDEYVHKAEQLLRQNVITEEDLRCARIERYIIGPVFNLDFFYSPVLQHVELLGIDWRFETSLDGHVRLPADQQLNLSSAQKVPEYTVCGHNLATLRESLLDRAFALAEQFVAACEKHYPYGVIGPFCLQTCVDKDLNFYIYDVAPRIGGGTNVHMSTGHPYGNTLWRRRMSTGRRVALEIAMACERDMLAEVVS
jgi:5-formaminoimidazole-4-carboxamide-1-(beta)-D-ribofuranosyl 5'-monophosphate synthetase